MLENEKRWFDKQISILDPKHKIITINDDTETIAYSTSMQSGESYTLSQLPEEYVHALFLVILCEKYGYRIESFHHEKRYERGSMGTHDDEMDFVLYDEDGLPYALIELKPYDVYKQKGIPDRTIRRQLFAIAPLEKNPRLLVLGTINPNTDKPDIIVQCIDYTKYKSYESWEEAGKPVSSSFPVDYTDLDYKPYIYGGEKDLRISCKQSDFKAVATEFHNTFFGEHPDNSLFVNLVKCLLAKIYDERTRKRGEKYLFQVEYKNGKPEKAEQVFNKINALYKDAYLRYIDPNADTPDEIEAKDFSPERVKEVVFALEDMSLTRGAALNGDIIGAFFEEILRSGFKQDKGMYFTHSNIARFMIEAIDLDGLTCKTWKKATHPDNRLPYIIEICTTSLIRVAAA